MRHERGVLDTSVVIALHLIDRTQLAEDLAITTVTLAELCVGPLLAEDVSERVRRRLQLDRALHEFDVLPFDAPAAWAFGKVAASLRRAGRKSASRRFDALIAATALANALPLYTANPGDVAGIDGLEVVEVGAT
jgi:tRNA(fMet)-specific endonuclease VapC